MKTYRPYYLILLGLYFGILVLRYWGVSEPIYFGGDEPRHFMNGVFFRDLFTDGGWRSPLDYLTRYYLKYPALSVHQYPPLFYLAEALLFLLFGIHLPVAQGMIFVLEGCGFYGWYRYIQRKLGDEVAFLSLLIWLSTPLFLKNFAHIMLDSSAVAVTLIFIVLLDRWQRSQRVKDLLLAGLVLFIVLGIDFKPYFLVGYLGLMLVSQWSAKKPAATRWKALGLTFLGIFYAFVTFGTIANITRNPLLYRTMQGINMMNLRRLPRIWKVPSVWDFQLLPTFGIVTCLLTLLGFFLIVRRKAWQQFSSELLYSTNFLFIFAFCILHFEPARFNLFLLPGVALFAGYGLSQLLNGIRQDVIRALGMAGLVVSLGGQGIALPVFFGRGYEMAARELVAMNQDAAPILCDAFLDGTFISYVRKYDPFKRQIVFRGDKILFVATIYYSNINAIYIHTEDDLYERLDRYGIRYIVADGLYLDLPPKALLRQALQDAGKFKPIKTYPWQTNIRGLQQAGLRVYEYLGYKTDTRDRLTIDIPVMQTKRTFTLEELRTLRTD
jgi:hypothetical protein